MLGTLFLQGWLIGFSIAMPVGPIGMLCIQHALMRGALYGLVAGLGAAFADALYGAIAGFGLTMVSNFIAEHKFWLQLGGSVFLWYLGVSIFLSAPKTNNQKAISVSLLRVFLSTFLLTLTNPMTLLCFAGVYAGLGVCNESANLLPAGILTIGVLVGSAVWWLLLSGGVAFFGKKVFGDQPTRWLNRFSGGIIMAFALITSVALVSHFVA